MKKLYFYICAVIMSITVAKAQQAVAVLTHEGTSKTFSGYNALQNAYKEAAHGDLITLSSGTFASVSDIEKAVKIRGAGMEMDTIYNVAPTILSGDMNLKVADSGNYKFRLEGIYTNSNIYYYTHQQPEFVKCRLSYFKFAIPASTLYNALFYHCRIVSAFQIQANSSVTCINCYIDSPRCEDSNTSKGYFNNCVITADRESEDNLFGCTLTNCVFANSSSYRYNISINEYTIFHNCLIQEWSPDKTKNTYITFKSLSDVFKTYRIGSNSDAEDFELLPAYNSLYGIYSSDFPYSPRLSGPHIQLMEVAPRTSDAGTLNVRIKVENTIE